ncbi:MAG: MoaD/ThiS family protein [Opitutales bacterium]|nr:MoaD/ThiS family protein [Opitutales bacterium]
MNTDTATISLKILYFAQLEEERGCFEETIEYPFPASPLEVYQHLREQHQLQLSPKELRVAINDCFSSWETPLKSHDTLAFLPPVAGG